MKVLITGITGFVGSHLAEHVLAESPGTEILGLIRWRSPKDNIRQIEEQLNLCYGDLLDQPSLRELLREHRPEIIFHLAAQSYVDFSFQAPIATLEANVLGTANLLEAVKGLKLADGYDPLIHVCSSSEVYGQVEEGETPITENNPFRPASPYAVSKVAEDMLAFQYWLSWKIRTIRTRMFTHTGPRRGEVFVTSAFAKQIAAIEAGKQAPEVQVGNLDSVRTFLDVKDAVRAYWMLVNKCQAGEVYNIGGKETMTVGEMLNRLLKLSTVKDIKVTVDPARLRCSDVTLQIPCIDKFVGATGWQPEIAFENTLQDTLEYWREYTGEPHKVNMDSLNKALYEKLYLIRRSEEEIVAYYPEDDMKTPMHMTMGGEAIAAGVCQALSAKDQVFGTYRSHGIFLAKTMNPEIFFGEMYGKDNSPQKGIGGSMHLCAPEYGFMGASAIVASGISVAVGAAFANKRAGNGKLVAVFFGDGAVDAGTFWESINLASLMKIPLLFVCEDNGLAVHTNKQQRHGYNSLAEIVSRFNCRVFENHSTDAEEIFQLTETASKVCRDEQTPVLLQLGYYRYLEHVGIAEDFDAGYRSREEYEKWAAVDPVTLQRKKLLESGVSESEVKELEERIDLRVADSVEAAKQAPFTDISELEKHVFV